MGQKQSSDKVSDNLDMVQRNLSMLTECNSHDFVGVNMFLESIKNDISLLKRNSFNMGSEASTSIAVTNAMANTINNKTNQTQDTATQTEEIKQKIKIPPLSFQGMESGTTLRFSRHSAPPPADVDTDVDDIHTPREVLRDNVTLQRKRYSELLGDYKRIDRELTSTHGKYDEINEHFTLKCAENLKLESQLAALKKTLIALERKNNGISID
jgi:septation ring formation regulator EzrA